ncbi:MAG: sigma-54-dependent transcriptional regulator, partial [Rubrivivax sp.]
VAGVLGVGSAEEAQSLLVHRRFELLILDVALPGKDGITLLQELRAQGEHCEVVLVTAFADLDNAIRALRAGASDFLLKPFRITQVLNAVQHALERTRLRRENWVLRRNLSERTTPTPAGLVGHSIAVRGLQAALHRLAAVGSTVLLTGESGTGKELAAQALHRLGPHAAGPYVPVNCATMTPAMIEGDRFAAGGALAQRESLFVYAQGGTLFLDEVGELGATVQALLLRVLEDRHMRPWGSEHEVPVDVRVVAATSRRLTNEVAAGRFRKDLYYRLQVIELDLPPLRAHKEDIPDLVAHFIVTLAPRLHVPPIAVSDDEMRFLMDYDWPGNVRELRNLIERSLIVGTLNVSALYQGLVQGRAEPASDEPVDLPTREKRHILTVLASVGGDKARAARLLGISRRTLERRCAEWQSDGGARGA